MPTDPSDDCYDLLGVDADADDAALRRAWRRLAPQWHPDRAGADATVMFQKIAAAYTLLSDPVRRAAYDRRRGTRKKAAPPAEERRAPSTMIQRLSGPLNALSACGVARWADDDVLELFLSPDEARDGGNATISMRVPVVCQACVGDQTAPCGACGGARYAE